MVVLGVMALPWPLRWRRLHAVPVPRWHGSAAEQLWTNATWNSSGAETHDYGAITLNCDIDNTTGYFGWTSSSHTIGSEVDTRGYPADKPSGTQWDADNCSTASTGTVQCTLTSVTTSQLFSAPSASTHMACTGRRHTRPTTTGPESTVRSPASAT